MCSEQNKKQHNTNKNKNAIINILAWAGNRTPGTLAPQSCVTFRPPKQLSGSIAVITSYLTVFK